MAIYWSSADSADPEKWIAIQIARGRAWWRRRRERRLDLFGETLIDRLGQLACPATAKKAATKERG